MSRMLGQTALDVANQIAQRRLSLANMARAGQAQQQQIDDAETKRKKDEAITQAYVQSGGDLGKFAELAAPIDPDIAMKASAAHEKQLAAKKQEVLAAQQAQDQEEEKRANLTYTRIANAPEEFLDRAYVMERSNLRGAMSRLPQSPKGLLEAGNIDLSNRPRVQNPDGTVSSVRSIGIGVDGKEVLIPTVSDDGRVMSDDEAVAQFEQTGRHLGVFDSPESATAYAQALHESQAARDLPQTRSDFEQQYGPLQEFARYRLGQAPAKPKELTGKAHELEGFYPNWDKMTAAERLKALTEYTNASTPTPKAPAPVPGRDVPFSKDVEEQKLRMAKAEAAVKNASTGTPANENDVTAIADAIVAGDQPPDLKGLYRMTAPVKAELSRRGYNQSLALSDWNATQRHLSTLNSGQQERLRQAVTFTYDSLDVIDDLYNQWKNVAGVSGFKDLNKINLAASKRLPGEAGAIATNLEAQIADLVSELGTVYKGGNSSTDHSLQLAAENLKTEWNQKTFEMALKQIRTNLAIRKNSIQTSQPAGIEGSRYSPTPATVGGARGAPAPAAGGSSLTAIKPGGAVEALINRK